MTVPSYRFQPEPAVGVLEMHGVNRNGAVLRYTVAAFAMRTLVRACVLAGTFGLAVLLAAPSSAQDNGTPHNRSGPHQQDANSINQSYDQNSQGFQEGYLEGMKDRSDNLQPRPQNYSITNEADRRGYGAGYRAGYCHNEISGYYNGTYSSWAPPIVRDGYYGYNAPNPFCENRPVQIVSAWYGAGNQRWNVTKQVKHMVKRGDLNILAANKTFGGDPVPCQPKVLTLTFIYDGKTQTLQIPEDQMFQLP